MIQLMETMKTKDAIKLFADPNSVNGRGGKMRLAKALHVSRQAISQWGEDVPPLRVYQIKEILGKKRERRSGIDRRKEVR